MKRVQAVAFVVIGALCIGGCAESATVKEHREAAARKRELDTQMARQREEAWDKLKQAIQKAYEELVEEFESPNTVKQMAELKVMVEEILGLEKAYLQAVDSGAKSDALDQIAGDYEQTVRRAIVLASKISGRMNPLWFTLRRLTASTLSYDSSRSTQQKIADLLRDAHSYFDPLDAAKDIWIDAIMEFANEHLHRKLSKEEWNAARARMSRELLEKRSRALKKK